MKNLFKFGFLAFAISLSVAACNTNKSENNAADSIDSTADVTSDSLENMADTVDSAADVKIDSVKEN
ncbi:MAG: hypothetical protein ABI390_07585 [Daejeonella sp.]